MNILKYVLTTSIVILLTTGCNAEKNKTAEFTVEFLSKDENKAVLNEVIKACENEAAKDDVSIQEAMSLPNCENALLAANKRNQKFNDPSNTKRRESVRAFSSDEIPADSK